MLKVIDKVLPCLVVRGPVACKNVCPTMSIFKEAVADGLKCLANGCDACTAACYVAKELANPDKVANMFIPPEEAPNLNDTENPLSAFAAIALDKNGGICTIQMPKGHQGITKAGFYSTHTGGISIAANPELAECMVNTIKAQISPVCMLKHLFAQEENAKGPLGGICMDSCGGIGVATLNCIMPWAAGNSSGECWSGYEGGRFSILNSRSD